LTLVPVGDPDAGPNAMPVVVFTDVYSPVVKEMVPSSRNTLAEVHCETGAEAPVQAVIYFSPPGIRPVNPSSAVEVLA
jgi:hypothetical protein